MFRSPDHETVTPCLHGTRPRSLPTEDRCMDQQHLARLDDDGSVRTGGTGAAGGPPATTSSEGPEVPAPVHALEAADSSPALVRRVRRSALCAAAALVGVAGLAVTAAGEPSQAARADESVSVAEELGMVQAEQPELSEDEATARLQQLVASPAEREAPQ